MCDELRNIVYYLPCKPGSVYVNITDQCLNECLFCIKRSGPVFFGCDLSLNGRAPGSAEVIAALSKVWNLDGLREIVFCGMGEPLLRYDCVSEVCAAIRQKRDNDVKIRVDTSGLFWANTKRLDVLRWLDVLSVSLNAENGAKYQDLCRPRIADAYTVVMEFLHALRCAEYRHNEEGSRFPAIHLSVVDVSEEEYIPESGREVNEGRSFPVPDIEKCRTIAEGLGWKLVVKRLFRDSRDERWKDRSLLGQCARGVRFEMCKDCSYRH